MARLIVVVILALIAALAIAAYFLRPEPPQMPRDADHAGSRTEKECLVCHGAGEKHARKPKHPIADDCFRCHVMKNAA